jgi:glycosyltransferase involved in cell wall biosynthesis
VIADLVSTIIPVYNRPAMLREAVESVLNQTHRPIEVIIVDDGSTDETPRIAEALAKERPGEVHFLRQRNAGPGPAREAGRRMARGEFLQYLDSDDRLWPRKFADQVAALREHPKCGVAYGYTRLVRDGVPPRNKPFKWTGRELKTIFPSLLVDRWWCTHTPLYRRSVCDRIGPWTDMRWSQDWEYDGRIGALGTRLVQVKEFVSDHRHHDGVRQTSQANWMEPRRLRNRKRLLESLLTYAEQASVDPEAPERQHFTRWVFSLARQCAAVGLKRETQALMELAERSAGACRRARLGFRGFRLGCMTFGTTLTGRLCLNAQRLKPPGRLTMRQL